MPTNKNAAIRYQTLDKCFRDRRHKYYIEDLIDKCDEAIYYYNGIGGVSRRQIFEDIKFMESETGWCVPLERKQDGRRVYYRYSDPNFTINAQPLTDIIDAAINHQAIRIIYRNYKNYDNVRNVIVHPWYIKQYNNRWFLMAYDAEANRISNFALDRIQEIGIEENVDFISNEKIDFEHYFDDVFGVTIPPDDVEKIQVVLQFSKRQYPYIVSKPIHHTQKIINDEECILSVELRPTYEFTQLILSFGYDVKVLEPETYKQEIITNIRRNLQNYDIMQIDCTSQEQFCRK